MFILPPWHLLTYIEERSLDLCISGDGKFHVDELRHMINRPIIAPPERITTWIHEVPLKFMCFIWRANLGRIPSAVALKDRGVLG